MDSRFAYNLHDVLNVASNVRIGLWEYFQTPKAATKPDLEIEWSGSIPVPQSSARELRNFIYEPDSDTAVFQENWLGLSMAFAVANLSSSKLKTHVTIREKRGWLAPVRPPRLGIDYLLRVLLHVLLIEKGYTITHAACLQDRESGKGLLIAAPAFSGKTSTAIALACSGAFNYLSDDMTIIDSNRSAFAYPTPVNASVKLVRTHGLAGGRRMITLSAKQILSRIVPEPLMYPRTMLQVAARVPISRTTMIDSICLLMPGSPAVAEVSKERALEELVLLNRGEFLFFEHPFILDYAYLNQAFPLQELERKHEDTLRKVVETSSKQWIVRASRANDFAEVIRRNLHSIL
jgi:hypothetical protein